MNAWKNKIFYSKAEKVKGTAVLLNLSRSVSWNLTSISTLEETTSIFKNDKVSTSENQGILRVRSYTKEREWSGGES
jgi:hypothetical protein